MAKDKKSFLLYSNIIHTVKKITDEQAGILFKTILSYVNDENPNVDNLVVDLVFEPIKQQLKDDLKKYEKICERNKNNGEKGGRPIKEPKKPSGLKHNPKITQSNPKKPDNDNDNDNEEKRDVITSLWKSDFDVYLKECKLAYKKFYNDKNWITEQCRLNPNVNVKLSIEKGFTNYWGKEVGWLHKNKSNTKVIDWETTIINSISMNKVYLTKQEQSAL